MRYASLAYYAGLVLLECCQLVVFVRRKQLLHREDEMKKSLEALRCTLRQHQSTVAYFKSLDKQMTSSNPEDRTCVICLEDIRRLTLTPCGHMFCFDCIQPCVITKKSCPTCRKEILVSQLVEVKVRSIMISFISGFDLLSLKVVGA